MMEDARPAPGRFLSRTFSDLGARLTQRERRMLLGLAAILLAVGMLSAFRWSSTQRDLYASAAADLGLAKYGRAVAARNMPDALDRAQLSALSEWSAQGRDIWFVRLGVERRIRAAAQDARLTAPEVQVAEAVDSGSALPVLRADVSGPYQGAAVVRFLRRLIDDPKVVLVDRVQVVRGQEQRYKLSLLFLVEFERGPRP